jgi:predicted Zn-dependent protease
MMKLKYWFIFLIIIILSFNSCGKRLLPSSVVGNIGQNYDEASFNYVYVDAIKQKLMGNNGDALKDLEQCIKINPQSDASYFQMAQILIGGGDTNRGKYYAKKAVSCNGENLWYLVMLAQLYYQEKNLDSAILYYEKAVKYFPDKETLLLTLGNLYSENKKYEKAKSIFDNLDSKYGVNESSTVSEVRSLMASGNFDNALIKTQLLISKFPDKNVYNEILAEVYKEKGDNEKALEVYKKLLEKTPDDGETQLAVCDFFLGEKKYDELFSMLNSVILNSGITREDKISLFIKLMDISEVVKIKSENLTLSLLILEANYPDDNFIPLLRPELLGKQNKFDEASIRLEEIIKKNPENYYAWEKLLLDYLQLGDYSKLFTRGEECATNFNRSFLAKLLYANGALEIGKYDIALEELKKAEILAEDNSAYKNQVLTMRADVYYRMKDYSSAFSIFEGLIKSKSEDLTVLNNYAYYLAEQNIRLKEAEQLARKVIERERTNNTFLDTYGWVLYKRGKINEAAKVMESIIASGDKPDAAWYEHYGYILKKQKKCSKAIENWKIAIKLDSRKTDLIKEIENCKK